MIKKLVPVLLPVLALIGGALGGDMLRAPPPEPDPSEMAGTPVPPAPAPDAETAWFTFPGQFFVPLVRHGDMGAIMVLTLTIETESPALEAMGRQEHRLRDALLRQLLIHANTGGFDGNFTIDRNLEGLRDALRKAAQGVTDLPVRAILIEDIGRQTS